MYAQAAVNAFGEIEHYSSNVGRRESAMAVLTSALSRQENIWIPFACSFQVRLPLHGQEPLHSRKRLFGEDLRLAWESAASRRRIYQGAWPSSDVHQHSRAKRAPARCGAAPPARRFRKRLLAVVAHSSTGSPACIERLRRWRLATTGGSKCSKQGVCNSARCLGLCKSRNRSDPRQ